MPTSYTILQLHLSVPTNFAPERADEFCPLRADKWYNLHLHLSVLTNFAPERADEFCP